MTFDRATALQRLADESFDVLVVGGGITGAGVALDAASRGLRTAVIERHDFASGTSSKSSKLVHGGLRYLQQREYRLVYEALAERQRLRVNAPHLVRVLPFLLPVLTKDGLISRRLARALGTAMWLYDLTGGLRIGKLHQRISKDEALAHMPSLNADRVAGGYLYSDAQADDARLTLTLLRTAVLDHGAVAANYASVVGLTKGSDGKADGAIVEADGQRIEVRAAVVVNAAGVWADEVRALDEGTNPGAIRPAKGVHITVPWSKVRNDIAAVVPVPKDKRSVFVVPWGEGPSGPLSGWQFTYVGTTDTDYDGPIDDPQCTPEDVAYLLKAINFSVAEPLDESDILGTWAGLRPLVRDASSERTADLSRRHAVMRSAAGVITVTGGKLTTYRKMAADAVDAVVEAIGRGGQSRTKKLPLRGAEGWESIDDAHLASRYGAEARVVRAIVDAEPSLGEPLVRGLPYLRAEAVYAARYEMARTLDDVLSRRTRARLLGRDASAAAAADVAALIAGELGWTPEEQEAQVRTYVESIDAERAAADLPETALDQTVGA